MAFDPSKQPRDDDGKWATTGSAGAGGRSAAQWIRSDEAKAIIKKISAPENIKSAAAMAIQSALFQIGVNDPHIDQSVSHQVKTFANNVKVTRAHARQMMITAIKALKAARE